MINPAKETYDPIEAIPAGKGIAPCVIQFPYLDIIIDLDQGISVTGWRLSGMAPISKGT
jgi:hypothetical protein